METARAAHGLSMAESKGSTEMKIQVDTGRCQGTAMCLAVAPDLFDLDANGIAEVLVDELGPDLIAQAEEAVLACPAAALTIVEDK